MRSKYAFSIAVMISCLSSVPPMANGAASIHVDEKNGIKHIFGGSRVSPAIHVSVMAYMKKQKDVWVASSPVKLLFEGNFPEWKLLNEGDKVTIYTAERKFFGVVDASSALMLYLVMEPNDFIDFAQSSKAAIVSRKTRFTFSKSTLAEISEIADELENNSNLVKSNAADDTQ